MDTLNARTVVMLGTVIRQLREQRGLTQGALASQAGVSRPWLNQLEGGQRDNAELAAVLAVLNVLDAQLAIRTGS